MSYLSWILRGSLHWVLGLVLTCAVGGSTLQAQRNSAEQPTTFTAADSVARIQQDARETGAAPWGHWGLDPGKYSQWRTHSNRLIPIYSFGIKMDGLRQANPYHDAGKLKELFGTLPDHTLNSDAQYLDQTQLFDLQQQAVAAGKKYIFVVLFDGLDWHMTRAAAHYNGGRYQQGRGAGLAIQEYRGTTTDFSFCVTSPFSGSPKKDVNAQVVIEPNQQRGGYDPELGGQTPWERVNQPAYLTGKYRERPHAYTDSSASATSICSGFKTYNEAINVYPDGRQGLPLARRLQADRGFGIGVVTSVPISHATPACAYANNVHRGDYQDLTRDLLGLRSISHRVEPLPGVDVLLGGGWGEVETKDNAQGQNFVPGNKYLTEADLAAVDAARGGRYTVVQRQAGVDGSQALREAAQRAVAAKQPLFGFFGVKGGHLPYRTANGDYRPRPDVSGIERYALSDVEENPSLAEMTTAALQVLEASHERFWLMVEPGDVDWASHANNIDNAIGAVLSGDEAFEAITRWVESRNAWDDTVVIVSADHGHLLHVTNIEAIRP